VGKYYPVANSQPDAESFAVSERDAASFVNSAWNTLFFTVADVRISSIQPPSNGVGSFDACASEFPCGGSKRSQ